MNFLEICGIIFIVIVAIAIIAGVTFYLSKNYDINIDFKSKNNTNKDSRFTISHDCDDDFDDESRL